MKYRSIGRTFSRYFSTSHQKVRVRFAPSPTGKLHLGGLRTALYNFIFARKHDGKFILRIEDTDQSRLVPESARSIEHLLNWANLTPDESPTIGGDYGPYIQSSRLKLYQSRADELLESGKAYRCFCSHERLELLRKYQSRNRERPHYDGKCKLLSPSEIKEKLCESKGQYTVRFALESGVNSFKDLIFGEIKNDLVASKESDPIILKSDRFPTYHFANVVDDHEMDITHVLRGSEWIASTNKHIQIYEAFGWNKPSFLHFPLITMKNGAKMSKRNNRSHVDSWIEDGYRPLALLNFLINMGGGVPKWKQDSCDLWPLERIIQEFDFSKVTSHPASLDLDRLDTYNSKDLKETWKNSPDTIISELKQLLRMNNLSYDINDCDLAKLVDKIIDRLVTLNDLISEDNKFIWTCPKLTWLPKDYEYPNCSLKQIITDIITTIDDEDLDLSDRSMLNSKLVNVAEKNNIGYSKLMALIRIVLTNRDRGLPVYELFNFLNKNRLMLYLKNGLKHVS